MDPCPASRGVEPMDGDGVERPRPIITWRAFVLGLLSCVGVLYFIIQVGQGLKAGGFVKSQYPIVALMPFVLWIFVNVVLKRVWPAAALRQGELLVLFSMLWVAGTMPQLGWMTYWAAIVAGPGYHATPENPVGRGSLPLPSLARFHRYLLPGDRVFLAGTLRGHGHPVGRVDRGHRAVAGCIHGHAGLRFLPDRNLSAPLGRRGKTGLSTCADASGPDTGFRRPRTNAPALPLPPVLDRLRGGLPGLPLQCRHLLHPGPDHHLHLLGTV